MLYCLYLHRWMSHRFHLDTEQVPRRFQSALMFRNNLRNYAFVMHSNELKLWLHFTNMFLAGGRFTDKGQTQDYERGFADITQPTLLRLVRNFHLHTLHTHAVQRRIQ